MRRFWVWLIEPVTRLQMWLLERAYAQDLAKVSAAGGKFVARRDRPRPAPAPLQSENRYARRKRCRR